MSSDFDFSVFDNPPDFEPPVFEFKGCEKRDDVQSPFDLAKTRAFKLPSPPFLEAKKDNLPTVEDSKKKVEDDDDNKKLEDNNDDDDNNDVKPDTKIDVEPTGASSSSDPPSKDTAGTPPTAEPPSLINENFVEYLEMLKSKDISEIEKGVDGLTKSGAFAKIWAKKYKNEIFEFMKNNKKRGNAEFHGKVSNLLKKLLELTNETDQNEVAEELVNTILNTTTKDRYDTMFASFEVKVLKDKVVPIFVKNDKHIDFIKKCFKCSKFGINDYYGIMFENKKDPKTVKIMLALMTDLAPDQGTKFLENDGIKKITSFFIDTQNSGSSWFAGIFKTDPTKDIINLIVNFYTLILEKAIFSEYSVKSFIEQWNINKSNTKIAEFCKNNYRKMLRGDAQKLFISNNGLDIVYEDIKGKDIEENVWKETGAKKFFDMDLEKVKVITKDEDVWKYFKEGVLNTEKDSLTKIKLLYKLILEHEEKSMDSITLLDTLCKDGKDNDLGWQDLIKEVANNSKVAMAQKSKYKGAVIVATLAKFIQYMPNTLSGKHVYDAVINILEKFDTPDVISSSLDIIDSFYTNKAFFDEKAITILSTRLKTATTPKKMKILDILCKYASGSKTKIKVSVDNLLLAPKDQPQDSISDSVEKVVFILTKANINKNDAEIRMKIRTLIEKSIDIIVNSNTIVNALKVLCNYCFAPKVKMIAPEPESICTLLKDILVKKKGDIAIQSMCFFFLNFLLKSCDVAIPAEIKEIAVECVKTIKNPILSTFFVALAAKGILEPEMLDSELKLLVDNFHVKALCNILYNANIKKSGGNKNLQSTQTLIKKIFSIENFAVEVDKNPTILQLLYELMRFDNKSEEFIRGVGGIRMLVNANISLGTVKVLQYAVRSQESAYAFYNYGGVKKIMDAISSGKLDDNVLKGCGNILLRLCEFSEPCAVVAENLKPIFDNAIKNPDENVKIVFSYVLARVYYAKLGLIKLSDNDMKKLLIIPESVELAKPRLYAALYALYSTSNRKYLLLCLFNSNLFLLSQHLSTLKILNRLRKNMMWLS